tara:strand:+ start:38 stop:283 length:246 start_codon:yes stop_codon:yes gene_type:complete
MKDKFIHVIAVFIEGELSYVQTFDSLATAELFIDSLPVKLQDQISDVPMTDSLFIQDNGHKHFITVLNDIDGGIDLPSVLQ